MIYRTKESFTTYVYMTDDVIFKIPDPDNKKFLTYLASDHTEHFVMTRDSCPNGTPNNFIEDILEPEDDLAGKLFAATYFGKRKFVNYSKLSFIKHADKFEMAIGKKYWRYNF